MIKILFVCLGNICRSPMAEGMFTQMVIKENLQEKIHIESRATSTWEHGKPPHPETRKILDRIGAKHHHMKSMTIQASDFVKFDYIIGMDKSNVQHLLKQAGKHKHKIFLLRNIMDETKGQSVPDPYLTGQYEQTYQLLEESLTGWLERLKNELQFKENLY
ncbi:low molecular weight protein-tyrosine-phosphatase [Peloplasma aerotolerans]|uniref:protein-tyrosine-phosphatase n=1 Tax=Peloplasma aerotolerans TaxID=3044389 RepID=A0AAW6U414_9MOLU|nr:low molecular weight protein-tyrosine-phosphatase [Mariniplasma sp. M4Ah]MDI6452723.1 low molecular weight protein-tyrosine-phosphatase [Mariniplasma sp. M4Ah]